MTCLHTLPISYGYGMHVTMADRSAGVIVWCRRCNASVPATIDWWSRMVARDKLDDPDRVRKIIETGYDR